MGRALARAHALEQFLGAVFHDQSNMSNSVPVYRKAHTIVILSDIDGGTYLDLGELAAAGGLSQ